MGKAQMDMIFAFGEESYASLESLIKFNDGNFKSYKQMKFLTRENVVTTPEDVNKWYWIKEKIIEYTPSTDKIIVVNGNYDFGFGHRSKVPFFFIYEIDECGVVRKIKIKQKDLGYSPEDDEDSDGHIYHLGYEVEKMFIEWEREHEPVPLEKPEEPAPKPPSNHLGTVGERMKFEGECVFVTDFETAYGTSWINKFEDDEGNVFIYFGNRTFFTETKYSFNAEVKEHSDYKGEKQTIVKRPTKIKELTEGGD